MRFKKNRIYKYIKNKNMNVINNNNKQIMMKTKDCDKNIKIINEANKANPYMFNVLDPN